MKFLLNLLILAHLQPTFGQQNTVNLNPLTGQAFLKVDALVPGKLVDLQIDVKLVEGFFAYQERFRLKVNQPENILVGELFISPIIEFKDSISKKQKKGIKEQATITTQIQIPKDLDSKPDKIKLDLTYIACTKKICLTPRILQLKIPVKWKTPAPKEKIIGSLQIIKDKTKKQIHKVIDSFENMENKIEEQIETNLFFSLILIFFFGFLTSLTPCVYPMIPITLAVLGNRKKMSQQKSFLLSLFYVFGIAITYASLGLIAAQTGQLFGSLISHPVVVITICLILFAMGLGLLGLFEVQAPAFIRNFVVGKQNQKGYLGAFVFGLLAGVVASPCVGPILVGILTYIAKNQDPVLGFILLFTFAMGLGTLFILLGSFSHWTNKLPSSGRWMNGVKVFLATCLFGLCFYYAWPLIKTQFPKSSVEKSSIWKEYKEQFVKEAKEQSRPVIIDFHAQWCLSCTELDELTFLQPEIIERSRHFTMLKVDATSPSKELKVITDKYEVYGLPTIIFINSKGEVIKDLTLTGFEQAAPFSKRMDQLIEEKEKPGFLSK